MQEVNSLCTDSGPLRANTVLCYSTQYSLLVYYYYYFVITHTSSSHDAYDTIQYTVEYLTGTIRRCPLADVDHTLVMKFFAI